MPYLRGACLRLVHPNIFVFVSSNSFTMERAFLHMLPDDLELCPIGIFSIYSSNNFSQLYSPLFPHLVQYGFNLLMELLWSDFKLRFFIRKTFLYYPFLPFISNSSQHLSPPALARRVTDSACHRLRCHLTGWVWQMCHMCHFNSPICTEWKKLRQTLEAVGNFMFKKVHYCIIMWL